MMRALLIGYGKMGHLIAQLAPQYNIAVSSIVDENFDFSSAVLPPQCVGFNSLTQEAIDLCDIVFDFSHAKDICQRILMLAQAKKPMLVGTTGWEKSETEAKRIIAQYQSTLLCSPNFSLGIALFTRLVHRASELFSPFPQYDPAMLEIHHRQKQDAPSGTAKAIAQKLMCHYPEKKLSFEVSQESALDTSEVHVGSLRVGSVPGTHEVFFDSHEDQITLCHTARSREGFARGALQAAYWVIDKNGWYTLDDMIDEKIHAKPITKKK